MNRFMLALTLSAWAGTAVAQSNVTVYGVVDVALVRESGGSANSTKITSGVESGSRLGFKGSEDLGNGVSAIFLLENGFQADSGAMGQGGLLFGRQAHVGLRSERAGTVTLGRQYTPQYLAVAAADPFGSGMAGDTKNLMAATGNSASRMDNALKYASPVMGGVSGELVYGAGEVGGDHGAGRQWCGALAYSRGPFVVRLAQHARNNDTAILKSAGLARNTVLTGVLDAGYIKVHLAAGRDKGVNSALPRNSGNPFGYAVAPRQSVDSSVLLLGLTVPHGAGTWLASWIGKNDRTAFDQDAQQLGLGYRYFLSKRTDVYAAYAYLRNRNGAGYTVGSAIEGGTGNRGANLGIRHTF